MVLDHFLYDPKRNYPRTKLELPKKWIITLPFESVIKKRVAIIGAGISGLASAYELADSCDITLFEAGPRLGGHARTVMAGKNNSVPVDTGFIVFNYPNYPNLTRMFEELDVPVKKSNMNFAASIGKGRIEYGLRSIKALTAQKHNILRPSFWRMLRDIFKFNKHALEVAKDPDMTVDMLLDKMRLGEWFRKYYLLPISGAIWSSTPEQMGAFPARSLVQFFDNHALLSTSNHQWYTVDGGSIEYVKRIEAAIQAKGGKVRLNSPVDYVKRGDELVTLCVNGQNAEEFDEVVFACHSDDALRILQDPSEHETQLLSAMRYQDNKAVLHNDISHMPKRRDCWSSWVFQTEDDQPCASIGITYWMNSLQSIDESDPLFVTLNPVREIAEEDTYDTADFRHPIFDRAAIAAQTEMTKIQGERNTWYCGAYLGFGFHEDGYASAMKVRDGILGQRVSA